MSLESVYIVLPLVILLTPIALSPLVILLTPIALSLSLPAIGYITDPYSLESVYIFLPLVILLTPIALSLSISSCHWLYY